MQELAEELSRLKVDNKLIEADSVEGSSLVELYDITNRPAVVLTRDDGVVVGRWIDILPPATDISYLAHL